MVSAWVRSRPYGLHKPPRLIQTSRIHTEPALIISISRRSRQPIRTCLTRREHTGTRMLLSTRHRLIADSSRGITISILRREKYSPSAGTTPRSTGTGGRMRSSNQPPVSRMTTSGRSWSQMTRMSTTTPPTRITDMTPAMDSLRPQISVGTLTSSVRTRGRPRIRRPIMVFPSLPTVSRARAQPSLTSLQPSTARFDSGKRVESSMRSTSRLTVATGPTDTHTPCHQRRSRTTIGSTQHEK